MRWRRRRFGRRRRWLRRYDPRALCPHNSYLYRFCGRSCSQCGAEPPV